VGSSPLHKIKLDWITPYAESVIAAHARVSTKDPKRVSMNLSQYNQDNQYSSLLNPTTLSPSAKLNELQNIYKNQLDVYTDPYGLKHINTTNGIYTFDKNGNPVGFNLPSSDYRSQVQQTGTPNNLIDKYGNFANKYNKASGGTVRMPQEYSRGNWKLI
jgi:hypothetical protein